MVFAPLPPGSCFTHRISMNRSVLIAIGIFVAFCLYMLTGLFSCGRAAEPASQPAPNGHPVMTVKVRELVAEEVIREVVLSGKTQPSRGIDLRAETAGRVARVADLRGRRVQAGDLIAEIEMKDRADQLARAEAELEQARLEYEAALRLQEQGLRSAAETTAALARWRGTEQQLRAIGIDIRDTRLSAPFDGLLQERMVEVGDYLGIGDPVARIIDLDPLVVTGQATEFQIEHLRIGEHAVARLADGRQVEGHLRYVAGEADPHARTFTVELEVANPELRIPAGITAEIAVETDRVPAYRISPALISIADDGRFGIKIVDASNRVRFHEADVVKSAPDALWLGGLPDRIRLITVGQGFTQEGDPVETELETSQWE
jgi:multidrug efflux system membrane fusion protein